MQAKDLLSLTKTDLSGRIELGITEDTTCTDLSRILVRFSRLHPQVSVRICVSMSLVLRAALECVEMDAVIILVFAHEIRSTDVVLCRERLNWMKSLDLPSPGNGSVPFLLFDEDCFYHHWSWDIGQDCGGSWKQLSNAPAQQGSSQR